MKSVALVVLNYNDSQTVIKFVESVLPWRQTEFKCHLVVVDNESPDGSFEILKSHFKGVNNLDLLKSGRNGGYSFGNNAGVKYAIDKYSPEYIAISNPDVEINEMTMSKVLETFDYNEKIYAVSPVMKNIKGEYSIHSQKLPSYKDDLLACFVSKSATVQTVNLPTVSEHENCIVTEMIPGSFFVIRTDVMKKIDFLDDRTFLYCEERILGRRIKDVGGIEVFRSDLSFIHAHSVSINKVYNAIRQQKLIYKARLYYNKAYNHCGIIKLGIMKLCMSVSVLFLSLKIKVRELIKK